MWSQENRKDRVVYITELIFPPQPVDIVYGEIQELPMWVGEGAPVNFFLNGRIPLGPSDG